MAVAWVFPGQGAQVVGMGRDLYARVPAARDVFEQANQVLNFDLTRLCFEGPEAELTATEHAQPAILTVSVALLRALQAFGGDVRLLSPQAVAGHSLGEYSALVAAGALDFATAVGLVRRRGELMAAMREGTMAAVMGLDDTTLEAVCQEASQETAQPVVIANYNAPEQLVISGATAAVQRAGVLAKECGARRVLPLKVSAAFHSPLMEQAARRMQEALAQVQIGDPRVPLIANVTATPVEHAEEVRRELAAQVMAPVCWVASVHLLVAQGVSTFVEIGPGNVLTGLIKRAAPGAELINVRDVDEAAAYAARQG